MAGAFWSSLKRELVHRYRFGDRAAARRATFAWIKRYNSAGSTRASATSHPSNGNSNTVNPSRA